MQWVINRKPLISITVFISLVWLFILYNSDNTADLIIGYWQFFFLGVGGAVAANSTGAGGGIVFIPAFTSLGVNELAVLGTSIAIQCFGMTVGSVSWLSSIYRSDHASKNVIELTNHLLVISGVTAVAGMLCGQYLLPEPSYSIPKIFKYFSIVFGSILLIVTLRKNNKRHTRYHVNKVDNVLIAIVCFVGGAITSWISVGAGEMVALLLFFLNFPTMVAVCIAVCISSMSVLSGVIYHLFVTPSISWQILLFAAPGAMIGGYFARYLAERLGPVRLKIFFATWILVTGVAMT